MLIASLVTCYLTSFLFLLLCLNAIMKLGGERVYFWPYTSKGDSPHAGDAQHGSGSVRSAGCQETETSKWGPAVKPQNLLLPIPNSWEPSVQTHRPMGDIS